MKGNDKAAVIHTDLIFMFFIISYPFKKVSWEIINSLVRIESSYFYKNRHTLQFYFGILCNIIQ